MGPSSLPSWHSFSISQTTADLSLGPQATRVCGKRIISRRSCLRCSVYTIILSVVLVIAGTSYVVLARSVYGTQWGSKSLPLDTPTSHDKTHIPPYVIFQPPASPEPFSDRPLRVSARLPDHCLESHISLGYPCFLTKAANFDIVWTWVNGSDPRLQEAMKTAIMLTSPTSIPRANTTSNPASKLYRDHDELRHSLRSVLQHFRNYTRRFHLFMSDFPFTENDSDVPDPTLKDTHRDSRLGQLPSWLSASDQGRWRDGNVELVVAYQSQVFEKYMGTSFNSYGIESQLPFLPDVEQNFIYLNDDFFFMRDLLPSDFYTSAYGVVLRLDPKLLVEAVPASSKKFPEGEWGPLTYSNWLISERFGLRSRPYPVHAAKSFTMPLLQEAAHIWEDEFRTTAEHKFREMRDPDTGAGDAYMSFLLTNLVVERWREALLWSWVIGRIGGDDDQWSIEQQMMAWEELGGDPEDVDLEVDVKLTRRKTLEQDRVAGILESSGQLFSKRTAYSFSSADGYPYSYANSRNIMSWPRFSGSELGQDLCSINFHECIGTASSANEAFKLIAFEKPVMCGDCIIAALRSSSGVLGLSAFLPQRQRKSRSSALSSSLWDQLRFDIWGGEDDGEDDGDDMAEDDSDQSTVPVAHLPLVKTWAKGNFSLHAVLDPYGAVNVRAWALRLLERYRFVIGETSIRFLMIEGPFHAYNTLRTIPKDVALLCMNDDVKYHHAVTDKAIRDWQRHRWSKPADWER